MSKNHSRQRPRRKLRLQFLESTGDSSAISIDIITARYLCELGYAANKAGRPRDFQLRPDLTFLRGQNWIAKRHKPLAGNTVGPDSITRVAANAPHILDADCTDLRVVNAVTLLEMHCCD